MKKFIRMAAMLAVAGAALLTSCTKDYSADIEKLQNDVASLQKTVEAIQGQIANGAVLTAVNKTANGVQIVTTAGTYEITNGTNGTNGANGKDGKPGSVVTINEDGYWCIDGVPTEYKAATDPAPVVKEGITAVVEEGKLTLYGVEGGEGEEKMVVISLNGKIGYLSVLAGDTDEHESLHDYGYDYAWVSIATIFEQTNTFGPKGGEKINFVYGQTINYGSDILLRVSPVTYVPKAEDIKLVNSKGQILDGIYAEKVTPLDELLTAGYAQYSTKATMNSGLYVVSLNLEKDYDIEDLCDQIYSVDEEGEYEDYVLFAVTVDDAISGYDVALWLDDADICDHELYINKTNIEEIHNRYSECEDSTATDHLQELTWLGEPATSAILKDDAAKKLKKNVGGRDSKGADLGGVQDDRQDMPILYVAKGEEITIEFKEPTVKAFYVELDEAYALESEPSEINAWKSYEYENLNVLQMGSKGSITIKDINNVAGDIIGFRVHSVNLDGTLCDPDGRAFYVYVGEKAEGGQIVVDINAGATINGAPKTATTGLLALADIAPELKLKNANGEIIGWTPVSFKPEDAPAFDITFYAKDKKTVVAESELAKAVYVEVSTEDIAQYYDGASYKQTLTLKNDKGGIVQVINAVITKVMPTAAEVVEFRPKQEVEEGSGLFKAYMIPFFDKDAATLAEQQAQYEVGEDDAENGTKDLNNVFYGLTPDYIFSIANAAKKPNAKATDPYDQPYVVRYEDNDVTGLTYPMIIDNALIDGKTEHAVKVQKTYGNISRVATAKGDVVKEWTVTADQEISVIFTCWHEAETYAWRVEDVLDKAGKVVGQKDYTPAPQWTAEGEGDSADLGDLLATNSYNNDFFGGMTLAEIMDLGWLDFALDENEEIKAELVWVSGKGKKQVNPYFVPSIEDGEVVFTQLSQQVDSAPVADHEETLYIYVVDAFGHETAITSKVLVKAPNKGE